MTAYRDRVRGLTRRTETELTQLWREHQEGQLTERAFVAAAALAIARANVTATSLADLSLSVTLTRIVGETVPPLGLPPSETRIDQRRLVAAVRAVLDEQVQATGSALERSRALRLGRIGRNEPAATAAESFGEAMRAREIPGWIRVTDGDPCPLCTSWDDGVVRPPSVRMARHTGCTCVQMPVLRDIGTTDWQPA